MNPLFVAASEVQDLCHTRGWGFCFIGGLAVLRWGEPRLTQDVDLTILTGFGAEIPVVDGLLSHFEGRFPHVREFALQNRVVLLTAGNGIPVDVALGALDFEERTVQRASAWETGEASLVTCSAEDLVVHKAFAGRNSDWLDLEGIVTRQGGLLDHDIIFAELTPLAHLKGAPETVNRLRNLIGEQRS